MPIVYLLSKGRTLCTRTEANCARDGAFRLGNTAMLQIQEKGSTTNLRGLSENEVADRRRHGYGNSLSLKASRSYAQILRGNLFVPVNNILFVLGLALILLGQISDALISVGVAFFNVLVGTVQEIQAKRVLDRITLLTRPNITVIRGGAARSGATWPCQPARPVTPTGAGDPDRLGASRHPTQAHLRRSPANSGGASETGWVRRELRSHLWGGIDRHGCCATGASC